MKRKYIALLIIILFLTMNVKAEEKCESNELSRLKEVAKKVEFDYDYELVNGEAVFSINAVNISKEIRVLIIEDYFSGDYQEFKGSNNSGTLKGFRAGEKVVITIKAFVPNPCSGSTLLTKTIKLPYYNVFYSEEQCRGNEDFKYCQKLISNNITENEYNRQFEIYLKNKEQTPPKEEPIKEEADTTIYFIIGGAVIVIVLITIVIINIVKKRKRNQL